MTAEAARGAGRQGPDALLDDALLHARALLASGNRVAAANAAALGLRRHSGGGRPDLVLFLMDLCADLGWHREVCTLGEVFWQAGRAARRWRDTDQGQRELRHALGLLAESYRRLGMEGDAVECRERASRLGSGSA
ncbi:MAG: hypothetical protein K2X46_08760 [Roseomonas sp.]|nr:hypothetical protein [Roseomonas sp.]MBX9700831.1 hypothetical protein [Acetobacteraceae bacterium]